MTFARFIPLLFVSGCITAGGHAREANPLLSMADHEAGQAVLRTTQQLELDAWPIPSLQEEMLAASVEDEWKHLSAFSMPCCAP